MGLKGCVVLGEKMEMEWKVYVGVKFGGIFGRDAGMMLSSDGVFFKFFWTGKLEVGKGKELLMEGSFFPWVRCVV